MEINSLCTKHTLPRRSQPLPEANLGVASSGCTCITGHWSHPFSALRCCRGVLWLVFGKATCTDRLWMEQRNRSGYLILRRRSLHFFFPPCPWQVEQEQVGSREFKHRTGCCKKEASRLFSYRQIEMALKWSEEDEVSPRKLLSLKCTVGGGCGVRNSFNKHEQSVVGFISLRAVDYVSFLPVLWFAGTGDNPAPRIISLLKYVLSKLRLERSLCRAGWFLLRCKGT